MNDIFVVKTNGSKQPFDIQKIRNQIQKAYKGISLNPLELESKISLSLKQNIKTSEIQQLLVQISISMITAETPEMALVAGRLAMNQLHREVYKNTKMDHEDFSEYLKYAQKNNWYRKDFVDKYTGEDINQLIKLFNNKYDFSMTVAQVLSLKSKYLIKNKKGILEYPQFADMSSSMILASVEQDKLMWAKKYFKVLSEQVISLATPFKANLRRDAGNTGSCFIVPVGDSLLSISKTWQDMSIISAEGGGIGVYLTPLRPEGAYSARIPKANNISIWAKIINDIAVAVNQRGTRKGAITPALDWWHLDIFSFIEIKTETETDLRQKCFDLFPQMVVDSYFIDKIDKDEDVFLFDHFELKENFGINIINKVDEELYNIHLQIEDLCNHNKLRHKKIKAKSLWKKALGVWIETGDFYIVHKDGINLSNYLKDEGLIANSGNLCTESWSITKTSENWTQVVKDGKIQYSESDGLYHSCSLLSINLGLIKSDEQLKDVCVIAVRALDSSIDLGIMPIVEAKNSSDLLRNIGIGTLGTADWMAYNKLSYEKEQDLIELEKLYEKIAYYCYEASINLAIEKGSYPYYNKASYNQLFGRSFKELDEDSPNKLNWSGLGERIRTEGIRNFYLLATAPNTSTGILMSSTASWQPPQSKMNYQTLADMTVPVLPRYIKDRYWHYKGKFQYPAHKMIEVVTDRIQKWTDTGVSMEVYINPENTSIKLISDTIIKKFKEKKLKAVYYSITIDAKKDNSCTDCAN